MYKDEPKINGCWEPVSANQLPQNLRSHLDYHRQNPSHRSGKLHIWPPVPATFEAIDPACGYRGRDLFHNERYFDRLRALLNRQGFLNATEKNWRRSEFLPFDRTSNSNLFGAIPGEFALREVEGHFVDRFGKPFKYKGIGILTVRKLDRFPP